jgi:DNA polymerase (family 10)
MLDRLAIAAALREIGALLRLHGDNRFKARAYERAGAALEALRADAVLDDPVRLQQLPGVGAATARVIADLHTEGSPPLLDRLRGQFPKGVLQLQQVPHLTLRRMRALQDALGIASVDELEAACRNGDVRSVGGFGPALTAKILAGIEAWRRRGNDLLLLHADREADALLGFARAIAGVHTAVVTGAVRRRVELVDGLDVAVAAADVDAAVDACTRHPAAVAVVDRTTGGCALRLANGTLVRVHVDEPARFGALLVRTTGTDAHVAELERLAARARVELDDAGADEATVYARLGLPFVAPELREGVGELAAARAGRLPELLTAADLRGFVHCHTVWSDGRHTIEEMARAADAWGLEYLTITDHSTSAHYANGLDADRLREQWGEIARVQPLVRVRLLRGSEVDILADGALDFGDAILAQLDVVVASVHNRHRLDRAAATRRIVRALRHPLFKIWGHPLGRYVGSRPPIDVDFDEVLDAAVGARVAFEVNGDPHRLDLEPALQRAARARGIPFVVSTDAHSVAQLANLHYGVDMARRGWLTKADVLNTLPADRFAAAVRPSPA